MIIKDRRLLKLKITAGSPQELAECENFCKFIGIVPMDLGFEAEGSEFELQGKLDTLTKLVLQMADKIGMNLDEMGEDVKDIIEDSKLTSKGFVRVKRILQLRFPEHMTVVFDDLLKIFQKYNLSSLINTVDMLRYLYPWASEAIGNKYEYTEELTQMGRKIMNMTKAIIPEIEELQKANSNNPFLMYALLFCRKEHYFIAEKICYTISYFMYDKTIELARALLGQEPNFITVKLVVEDMQFDRVERTETYWNEIKNFFAYNKDFWYKYIKHVLFAQKLPNAFQELKSTYNKLDDDIALVYRDIIHAYNKADKDEASFLVKDQRRKMTLEKLYKEVIGAAMEETQPNYRTYVTITSTYETMSRLTWNNDDRKKRLLESRKAYMDKVRDDYIWMFGEYWETLHNLLLVPHL